MLFRSPLPTTTPVAAMGTSISSGPPVPFPSPSSAEWTPPASVDAYAPPVNPLIYFYGHTSPTTNPAMFDLLLKRVGKSLKRKLEEGGVEGWRAGVIVDTPGEWAEKKGMHGVSRAVRELESESRFAATVGMELMRRASSQYPPCRRERTLVRRDEEAHGDEQIGRAHV